MQNEDILKEVNDIFRRELDNDDLVINRETTAKNVDEWDSLSHIMLVVGIEKHFKIKFTAVEINHLKMWEKCATLSLKKLTA